MTKYLLLGEDAYRRYADILGGYGFTPIMLYREPKVNPIVGAHADTLVFEAYGRLIMNREYYNRLDLPESLARRIELSDDCPHSSYPNDVCFNGLVVGNCLVAKQSAISADLCRLGLKPVDVKQGYARCSTLLLRSVGAAITSDSGIADALRENGVRILEIESGSIRLDGCEYGFIGGATFVDETDCSCSLRAETVPSTVFFFGSPANHPDCHRILDFIRSYGYQTVFLPGDLTDYGGAVAVTA